MLILALDSTALVASVALTKDDAPLASFTLKNGNTHSETLLPMVKAALEVAGVSVNDVDLFACSRGPGSFTGVRIGAATVKGLAFGKEKPVIGVSTLEAMAYNLLPTRGVVCAVMNARRGQVYNALFRADGSTLTRLCPDRAIAAAELEDELAAIGEDFYLVGDGSEVALSAWKAVKPLPLPTLVSEQNAYGVALAALAAYKSGVHTTDKDLSPVYLRLPQAERERLERSKQ